MLSDYSYLIFGLIDLYQADFNPESIQWAVKLQEKQDTLFLDQRSGLYYDSDCTDKSLLTRSRSLTDSAVSSGNSMTVLNMLGLEDLTLGGRFAKPGQNLLHRLSLGHGPGLGSAPFLVLGLDYFLDDSKEIALVGFDGSDHSLEMLRRLRSKA